MFFLTPGNSYNSGLILWKVKAYSWFEYLSICSCVKCQPENIHVRIKVHHSINLAFSQDPLEQQPGIISKHLVATPFPSAAAQLISMPLACHTKYLHSLGVSPLLLWEKSRNHQSFIYLSFSLSSHRLTSHPWESKKNPDCYFLASKCYTSLLDQVSPTQACITSPIWLLCHCMPLVFFLPLLQLHRHLNSNISELWMLLPSWLNIASLFHLDKWQHNP